MLWSQTRSSLARQAIALLLTRFSDLFIFLIITQGARIGTLLRQLTILSLPDRALTATGFFLSDERSCRRAFQGLRVFNAETNRRKDNYAIARFVPGFELLPIVGICRLR
jgi:hypothetical protein